MSGNVTQSDLQHASAALLYASVGDHANACAEWQAAMDTLAPGNAATLATYQANRDAAKAASQLFTTQGT